MSAIVSIDIDNETDRIENITHQNNNSSSKEAELFQRLMLNQERTIDLNRNRSLRPSSNSLVVGLTITMALVMLIYFVVMTLEIS